MMRKLISKRLFGRFVLVVAFSAVYLFFTAILTLIYIDFMRMFLGLPGKYIMTDPQAAMAFAGGLLGTVVGFLYLLLVGFIVVRMYGMIATVCLKVSVKTMQAFHKWISQYKIVKKEPKKE